MDKMIKIVGDITAVAGLLICLLAGVGRLAQYYNIAGFEMLTLFTIGIAILVVSTLAKVQLLLNQRQSP